jgi:hypothetical protein
MFSAQVTFIDKSRLFRSKIDRAAYKSFSHAAASIRKRMMESIQPAEGPSEPGTPPHTHVAFTKKGKVRRGGQLRRAIAFYADKGGAVIGPRESIVGESAEAHEKGGDYKGQDYPKRPFALPALQKNLDRFAGEWAGSIGE